MNYILEIKNVNKVYEMNKTEKHHVLKNINLQIEEGEFIAVMGPSGSGKSTLLYTIGGMDSVTSGRVIFDGEEISVMQEEKLSNLRLNKMGFIFQQSSLLKNLTLLDNIILPGFMAKAESRRQINQKASELMKKMHIAELATRNITEASGGQLQRVSICRALINNPSMIFGDEPTGALNSAATNEVMEILTHINQLGTTIMLVTHDAKVAAKADRVFFMVDGEIIAEKYFGKYGKQKEDVQIREGRLLSWLSELGF
ncbi:ABC transporter ATP-binding protein [Bacillus manliponensis]|uniref:ABC transporter ATP-binding protein n=1 Tax=Bacillus manliponensis TaxID=574376 RepID=A0A073JVK7_9BACI|nr:ABC transporter ATP-binding protein [Bacillus manliponensis]KEK18246.1 ABC transporter ATP-binding protein [Bacillus manliponensis]